MYIGLHVKYPLFLSDFNETGIFSTGFKKKNSYIKFHENSSGGSRVPRGLTDMTKLIVAFCATLRTIPKPQNQTRQYFIVSIVSCNKSLHVLAKKAIFRQCLYEYNIHHSRCDNTELPFPSEKRDLSVFVIIFIFQTVYEYQ